MGRKVHPHVYRLSTIFRSNSTWFSRKDFATYLEQDTRIRAFLERKLKGAGLAKVEIERSANAVKVLIHTSKTGVVIGRGGKGIEALKKEMQEKLLAPKTSLEVSIHEVARPELSSVLVGQNIAEQLEKRIPFRRAVKRAIEQVRGAGAQGVKIIVAGRLNGAEIARTETFQEGKLPLQTLRANIDFARAVARTTYGAVGVKVWIYKGDIFAKDLEPTIGATVIEKRKRAPRR
jgi:small subunit ribosomal protein S3